MGLEKGHTLLTQTIGPSEADQSSMLQHITMIWLVGTLVLLPVDLIGFPLNINLVDVWVLTALPILWLSFVRGSHTISMAYVIPMWLIFVGSFVSTFAAPAPKSSLVVILKEVYAFVWFITLTAVLAKLNARDLRRILVVWTGVVFLHSFVLVAQFLSPDFWRLIASFAGRSQEFEIYRPSGLFVNANSAAFFQLLGFVPLMLVSHSRKAAMILGVFLFSTMLITGSMGATLAFIAGLTVAMVAVALNGHPILTIKMFMQLALATVLLGGLLYFVVSHNQRYQEHLEHILLGRADRSSEGRFDLWQRGFDAYLDHGVFLWGVGPENFREVDAKGTNNQLHNDFLAFSVERGLLGTLGLGLFAILALSRATYMTLISHRYPGRAPLAVVVFIAAIVAVIVESLSHQVFHFRALWVVLAFQEAIFYKMTTAESGLEPTVRTLNGTPRQGRGFVVRPDVTGG